MAENTNFEWCDHTQNFCGCLKARAECDNCNAEADFDRCRPPVKWGPGQDRHRTARAVWVKPFRWAAAHAQFYAEHGRHQRVFANSLVDWADNAVPLQWTLDMMDVIRKTPNLHWMLLTKRIGNVMELADLAGGWPANAAIGVTASVKASFVTDVAKLVQVKRQVNPLFGFVMAEPLLEDLGEVCLEGVDQLIVGGEIGVNARMMHPAWARSLRDQCLRANTPFMFTQWGNWMPGAQATNEHYDRNPIGQWIGLNGRSHSGNIHEAFQAGDCNMLKVGTKYSGRLLDGVIWSGEAALNARLPSRN